jgi:hypothetical protein
MTSFKDYFFNHRSRHCSKWFHYFSIYDRHFEHLKNQEFTLLEIGVGNGGSLQLWKKYFGSKVKIFGIDVNPQSDFSEGQIKIFIGNQSDTDFLDSVIKEIGSPTIIIDDGSHIQSDMIKSFDFLFPKLSENGIYIVEDCHTCYWPRFQGGVSSHLNFVDILSRTVHDVNHKWYNEPRSTKIKQLNSIHFYDSVVVLEKKSMEVKRHMLDVDATGVKILEEI